MVSDILQGFADQLDVDSDALLSRWSGRPDRIMEDLFQVPDMDTGKLGDLDLFDVQRKAIHAYFYSDAPKINTYKGRRIGYSFVFVLCFLLEGIQKPDSYYPIVSRTEPQASERIADIADLIEDANVEIKTKKNNVTKIILWNGTTFEAFSGDADTSRGKDSARAVLMDEMAFMSDQESAVRAFSPFLSLGQGRTMVQISTPNRANDLFLQTHKNGTPTGVSEKGNPTTLSIKQPSFYNADGIDINVPLFEQQVKPVRPDMNIVQIEEERQQDPVGFGQEYLCRPAVNEYDFFDPDSIDAAMRRGGRDSYHTGLSPPPKGGYTVLGVDIGIDSDDTVISVCEHKGQRRYQRYIEVVTNKILSNSGIPDPDRGNANHIARRIHQVNNAVNADLVVMDRTGAGETFQRITERLLGRSIMGFNFSDKEGVSNMFGDMNATLRNGEAVLVDNKRVGDEFKSIVKEKTDDYGRPKFTGKENSPTGKDDTVFATVLSAFPPKFNSETTNPASHSAVGGGSSEFARPRRQQEVNVEKNEENREPSAFGAVTVSRNRHSRRDKYNGRGR